MKRFLFCTLSILFFNFTDTAAMQNEPQESNEDLKNEEKMKQVLLHCCQADHKMNTQLLWFLLLITLDNTSFNELKCHIKNDSAEELNSFILQLYQEDRIPCAACGEYSGYYIQKKQEGKM